MTIRPWLIWLSLISLVVLVCSFICASSFVILVCSFILFFREMLTSVLRALVKNLVKENFDITFMRNEKSRQNINCFFFSYKNFL